MYESCDVYVHGTIRNAAMWLYIATSACSNISQ